VVGQIGIEAPAGIGHARDEENGCWRLSHRRICGV
jgi:hypothetical protein